MSSRNIKALYYTLAGPVMRVNGALYRTFKAKKNTTAAAYKIHLGPGQKKYMPGWVNLDYNKFTAKCDVAPIRDPPPPYHDNTVDAVYSHHMIEHLPDREKHLRDVFRVLKPGGVYRVAGPNGDTAVKKLAEGDKNWFGDWPDNRQSTGGRFENFIFCRGVLLTILFEGFLRELLSDAGFETITT